MTKRYMNKLFTITYLSALVMLRTLSFIYTQIYLQTFTDIWHHLYTGVILIIVLWLFKNLLNKKLSVILLAIALALIVDELILIPFTLFLKPDPIANYWSWYSWLGLVIFSLIVIKWQKPIINKFKI